MASGFFSCRVPQPPFRCCISKQLYLKDLGNLMLLTLLLHPGLSPHPLPPGHRQFLSTVSLWPPLLTQP